MAAADAAASIRSGYASRGMSGSSAEQQDIENLNQDSFIVREKLAIIKKLESDSFNLEKYIEELNKDISPWPRFSRTLSTTP